MKHTAQSILLACGLSLAFQAAVADRVEFAWLSGPGSLTNQAGQEIPARAATVLTFLSADDRIDFDAAVPLSSMYGDDVFFAARPNGLTGRYATSGMVDDTHGYVGYHAYAVILDLPFLTFQESYAGDPARIPAGTRYGISLIDGPLVRVDDGKSPPDLRQDLRAGGNVVTSRVVPGAVEEMFAVTVSPSPPEGGTAEGEGTYARGTRVTVRATPAAGFEFRDWTEDGTVVSGSASYSFLLERHRVLLATFQPSPSEPPDGDIPPPGETPPPGGGGSDPDPARRTRLDFSGDRQSDLGIYHPPSGSWYLFLPGQGLRQEQFGFEGTLPVVGDFDGDGRADFGVYHPPTGMWYLFMSSAGFFQTQFGFEGTVPVVGDFDGDGRDDFGCYHPPTGMWYLFMSSAGFFQTQFGFEGTVPVVGDFDGDGRDDFGCYHPPTGMWYLFMSSDGFFQTQFGFEGTVPVVGDFDGDGRDDIGCYHPASGAWYIFRSRDGFWETRFGFEGTIPVVGDFDGDGRDDLAVYDPPGGNWFIFGTRRGFFAEQFGYAGTLPLGGSFAPPSTP